MLIYIYVFLNWWYWYLNFAESKTICRQKVLDHLEFVNCPPPSDGEYKEFKYCCSNNGKVSCCNYNDYQSQHNGPRWDMNFLLMLIIFVTNKNYISCKVINFIFYSINTIYSIIIVEIIVVIISVWWCCTCFQSWRNFQILME